MIYIALQLSKKTQGILAGLGELPGLQEMGLCLSRTHSTDDRLVNNDQLYIRLIVRGSRPLLVCAPQPPAPSPQGEGERKNHRFFVFL